VRLNISSLTEKGDSSESILSPKQTLLNCRTVLDTLIKISQDTANDKAVAEAAVLKYIFIILASLVTYIEANNTKRDRRSLFERRGSLKKMDDVGKDVMIMANERPKSKGKTPLPLGSLNKKDSKTLFTHPSLLKE
jgi:hypothetical protein